MEDIYGTIPRLLHVHQSTHKAIQPMEYHLEFAVNVALVNAGVRPGYYTQGKMVSVREATPDMSVSSVNTHTTREDGVRVQTTHNFYFRLGHCNSHSLAEAVENIREGRDAAADIRAFEGHYTPTAGPPPPNTWYWAGTWVEWRCAFDRELSAGSGSFVLWREYLNGDTGVQLNELTDRLEKIRAAIHSEGLRAFVAIGTK